MCPPAYENIALTDRSIWQVFTPPLDPVVDASVKRGYPLRQHFQVVKNRGRIEHSPTVVAWRT